jgi:uncharacterized protein YdaT
MDLKILQDEAREAGKREGERKKAIEIAEALRKQGRMSEAEISELTGLSEKKETLK